MPVVFPQARTVSPINMAATTQMISVGKEENHKEKKSISVKTIQKHSLKFVNNVKTITDGIPVPQLLSYLILHFWDPLLRLVL